MKTLTLLVAALAAPLVVAQESPSVLDARVQLFTELIQPRQFVYANPGTGELNDQAKGQAGLGFRVLGELPYTLGWYYELGGRLDSSSNLTLNTTVVDARDIQIRYSYWSAGVAYLWNFGPLSLGAHLEGRGEALSALGEEFRAGISNGKVSQSTTYLRPWVRVSLDLTFGKSKVRPFVGGEAGVALTRTTQTRIVPLPSGSSGGLDDRTLRAMAPTASVAFYGGLRF